MLCFCVEHCSTPHPGFRYHVKMTLRMNSSQQSRQTSCHDALSWRISTFPPEAIITTQQVTIPRKWCTTVFAVEFLEVSVVHRNPLRGRADLAKVELRASYPRTYWIKISGLHFLDKHAGCFQGVQKLAEHG